MSEDVRTAEEIAQDYTAMGHSVELINGIIDGSKMVDESEEDKKDCVKRNVEHLEIMVAKDFWTDEDMNDVESAIQSGNTYLG
jgi:hypothetical protein